ncbi:hypothetical protein KEJ37_06920 [Candidatus Bathyarchaeota archaeon]|nr:hypothetical protein [Candidatus Bathyarchaeota archaeon]
MEKQVQSEGVGPEILAEWLEQLKEKLNVAGEGPKYVYVHCFRHPPDRHPSFVLHKSKFYGFDFHDGRAFSLKELAEMLGVTLQGERKDVIDLGGVQVQPLFNGLNRKIHPAIGTVDGTAYVSVCLPCSNGRGGC